MCRTIDAIIREVLNSLQVPQIPIRPRILWRWALNDQSGVVLSPGTDATIVAVHNTGSSDARNRKGSKPDLYTATRLKTAPRLATGYVRFKYHNHSRNPGFVRPFEANSTRNRKSLSGVRPDCFPSIELRKHDLTEMTQLPPLMV